jgi:hypothetical protein
MASAAAVRRSVAVFAVYGNGIREGGVFVRRAQMTSAASVVPSFDG